jgi:hypothetical protein
MAYWIQIARGWTQERPDGHYSSGACGAVVTGWLSGLFLASRMRFWVVPWTTVLYSFQSEVAMRADRVEVTWDKSKSTWLMRIVSGEEVIRRHCKLPKDSDEQALRSVVRKTLQDEGYEPDPISMDLEKHGAG